MIGRGAAVAHDQPFNYSDVTIRIGKKIDRPRLAWAADAVAGSVMITPFNPGRIPVHNRETVSIPPGGRGQGPEQPGRRRGGKAESFSI